MTRVDANLEKDEDAKLAFLARKADSSKKEYSRKILVKAINEEWEKEISKETKR